MNTSLSRLATLFSLAFALASCTSPGSPRVSQARQEFKTRTTYIQGIGVGALGGAAIGGLTQGIKIDRSGVHFDKKAAKRGAAYGALGGGIAGGIYAHGKVQERRQGQRDEAALDAAIAQARSSKEAAAEFNDVLAQELRSLKAGDARLAGTISDANAVLRTVKGELASKRNLLQVARSQGVSKSERDRLQGQINGLEDERVQLEGYIDKLARKANAPTLTGR